jgi:hypothetical protein
MRRIVLSALVLGLFSLPALASDYTFTVENNADQRIVKIEVSEDGESWAPFDIGKGIPSGESAELVWDSSTDESDCEWQFRATFSGGDVLGSDWVDFCEDDVVINFSFDE